MPDYHVGCGAFGIYAGTLSKNKKLWQNKSEVTKEALCAVAEYLMQEDKVFRFENGGKWFELGVQEVIEDAGIRARDDDYAEF